jgi:hypothetical protein
VTHDHDPSIHQYTHAGRKEKTRENNSETQSSTTFHKGKVFTKSTSSLTGFWAKYERLHYIKKDYMGSLSLRHLNSRLRGGRRCGRGSTNTWRRHRALVAGVEEAGVEVEEAAEAAEGVIIDTMPGSYFFAFSKKPSSSERGRPREELIFSQSTSSPCE